MKNTPLILITNDDGINAPGIEVLKKSLQPLGDVIVVAPDSQKSAVSSSLTINRPLRVSRFYKNSEFFGFAVDGTPTDCVKLALTTILDRKPDLVVSGINHGKNTSINVLYSGTVAGAAEGIIAGINSIAISYSSHSLDSDISTAGRYSCTLARKLLRNYSGQKILLNVNIPSIDDRDIKGVRITRLSSSKWLDKYEKRLDPFGNEYYWFAGEYSINETEPDTDDAALGEGFISVSPINLNPYCEIKLELDQILEISYGNIGDDKRIGRGNDTG